MVTADLPRTSGGHLTQSRNSGWSRTLTWVFSSPPYTCPSWGAGLGWRHAFYKRGNSLAKGTLLSKGINYEMAMILAVQPESNTFSTTPAPRVLAAVPGASSIIKHITYHLSNRKALETTQKSVETQHPHSRPHRSLCHSLGKGIKHGSLYVKR